jgi:hypothetical protein
MQRANALSLVIGMLGLAVATAAFAADEPTAPSASPPATAAGKQRICRNRLRPGSHIATRTCLTAAQWAVRTWPNGTYAQGGGVHEGLGPWGQVSTAGQSAGASAFTAR